LPQWVTVHPAALAHPDDAISPSVPRTARDALLAEALVARNAAWGNPVEEQVRRWLAGAEVVASGQQPGLLGGPLLTLIKACAVAAEVRRRRAAGREAVGFFWLATNDDDLPEMGWARVALGEEVVTVREERWPRGATTAGHVLLGGAAVAMLEQVATHSVGERAREALALARRCYQPGVTLGEATGRFLGELLRGLGVVLVDALEPALAKAGRDTLIQVLARLPQAWSALQAGGEAMAAQGWPVPLRLAAARLPVFRLHDGRRERLAARGGACPPALLREVERHPERFSPNVWVRPLLQDAVLHTSTALLGGAELAYHRQGRELWELVGVPRPAWRLRPHVTVVTAAERRLAAQLRVGPEDLLRRRPPRQLLRGRALARRQEALAHQLEAQLARLETAAQRELPMLVPDVRATAGKVAAALQWLQHRTASAQARSSEVEVQRWRRLTAFLRPDGRPQERRLSVLAPLLRLGLQWPAQLAAALDATDPGMHLMCWAEGGPW
jgi:uncharacterized protein YllA (UPF0747 family)